MKSKLLQEAQDSLLAAAASLASLQETLDLAKRKNVFRVIGHPVRDPALKASSVREQLTNEAHQLDALIGAALREERQNLRKPE